MIKLLRVLITAAWCVTTLHAHAADTVSEQLAITGNVKTALTLKLDELKTFPPEQIASVTVTRKVDGKEVSSTLRGVRLTALLDRAGLVEADHNTWKHTIVTASATDGYRVVFSWSELFNTEVGAGVLAVFERDGQPLADREGRISLVSARDQKGGPRSVRWLSRLEVKVVND